MSSDFSGADLYFDAMDSGPAEEGTITPPEHYDRMKRMEELRRQRPHTLWTDLKNLWYEALGVSLSFRPSSRATTAPRRSAGNGGRCRERSASGSD